MFFFPFRRDEDLGSTWVYVEILDPFDPRLGGRSDQC